MLKDPTIVTYTYVRLFRALQVNAALYILAYSLQIANISQLKAFHHLILQYICRNEAVLCEEMHS